MFQWALGSQWLFIFWSDPASLIIFKVVSFIKKVDICLLLFLIFIKLVQSAT